MRPTAALAGRRLALHRSGALELASTAVRPVAVAAQARATHNLTPAHASIAAARPDLSLRPRRPDAPGLPHGAAAIVVAQSERVMAIADLALVSDQTVDPAMLQAIASWLGVAVP